MFALPQMGLILLLSFFALQAPAAPPASAPAETTSEPAPQRASADELKALAARVSFYRGRLVRETSGFHIDIPPGFHVLDNADARSVEAALGLPPDAHLIAWAVEQNLPLTDPALWAVKLRWMSDGLVRASSEELDAAGLLNAAHTQPHIPRLAGSGGKLLRFVSPPTLNNSVVAWVEERQPDGEKKSVFDCHALRLARKGVLEFSIVGADDKLAKSCMATLLVFTNQVKFEPALDYPVQVTGNSVAAYSLSGLVAQTQ